MGTASSLSGAALLSNDLLSSAISGRTIGAADANVIEFWQTHRPDLHGKWTGRNATALRARGSAC
jgi:hypothetical protein